MMDCRRYKSAEQLREDEINQRREDAYQSVCPPMNRAERRSAKGKMLIALAEAAALRAEIEFLKEESSTNK